MNDLNQKIELRNDQIDLLEAYSKFLEESGYIDSDWWAEKPTAIDEFLAHYKNGRN